MAYLNTTRTGFGGIADRVATMIANAREASAKRRVYTQTVEELNNLTDRELADLGISRLNIADIAAVAAYGK